MVTSKLIWDITEQEFHKMDRVRIKKINFRPWCKDRKSSFIP